MAFFKEIVLSLWEKDPRIVILLSIIFLLVIIMGMYLFFSWLNEKLFGETPDEEKDVGESFSNLVTTVTENPKEAKKLAKSLLKEVKKTLKK